MISFVSHFIELDPKQNNKVINAVIKDSLFLESLGIMDYSLLIGIEQKTSKERDQRWAYKIKSERVSINVSSKEFLQDS